MRSLVQRDIKSWSFQAITCQQLLCSAVQQRFPWVFLVPNGFVEPFLTAFAPSNFFLPFPFVSVFIFFRSWVCCDCVDVSLSLRSRSSSGLHQVNPGLFLHQDTFHSHFPKVSSQTLLLLHLSRTTVTGTFYKQLLMLHSLVVCLRPCYHQSLQPK